MEAIKEQRRLNGLEAMKRYRATEEGKAKIKEQRTKYKKEHNDKIQESTKKYNDKNRERINENMRQRRSKFQ